MRARAAETPLPTALFWSGGKDSLMALEALQTSDPRSGSYGRVEVLLTTTDEYGRVAAHGVPAALIRQQAASLGYELRTVSVPGGAPNAVYEGRVGEALRALKGEGIGAAAAGDLFLEEVRRYRQRLIEDTGLQAAFPLWGRPPAELARAFIGRGFSAVTVAVDARVLPRAFLGRAYDRGFLEALPEGVDPCGENGEFHTFVTSGPTFRRPVTYRKGAVGGERHVQLELLPD